VTSLTGMMTKASDARVVTRSFMNIISFNEGQELLSYRGPVGGVQELTFRSRTRYCELNVKSMDERRVETVDRRRLSERNTASAFVVKFSSGAKNIPVFRFIKYNLPFGRLCHGTKQL
jgi:hypothetical protein